MRGYGYLLDHRQKRLENFSKILTCLHEKGPLKKQQISSTLGIRPNSVGSVCDELLEMGLLEFSNPEVLRSPVQIRSLGAYVYTLHMGREGLEFAMVDLSGGVVGSKSMGPEAYDRPLETLCQLIADVFGGFSAPKSSSFLGVCMSSEGWVNDGQLLKSPLNHLWKNFPLEEHLSQLMGCSVYLDSQARSLAEGYWWFETELRALRSVFVLCLDHCLSSSMIMNGEIPVGGKGLAGELGHMRAEGVERQCWCGQSNCLETYVSFEGMVESLNLDASLVQDWGSLVEKDGYSQAWKDEMSKLMGAIRPILSMFDPDGVIVITPDRRLSSWVLDQVLDRQEDVLNMPSEGVSKWAGQLDPPLLHRGLAALAIKDFFRAGGV